MTWNFYFQGNGDQHDVRLASLFIGNGIGGNCSTDLNNQFFGSNFGGVWQEVATIPTPEPKTCALLLAPLALLFVWLRAA
jgi:hypothetical protein